MRIAVVGLGIAGMRAAMLLERAGVEVELFEARDRLGGRMYTAAHGEGVVYEAGGEWIDADHERCLSLLHELGLAPVTPDEHPRHYVWRDQMRSENDLWPEAVEDELRFEAAARELCRDLTNPPWRDPSLAGLDHSTLAGFLESNALSAEGRWYLRAVALSDEGDDPERIGLLGWLSGYLNYLQRSGGEMSAFQVSGGAQALFSRMASRLSARPVFGAVLERVLSDGSGVRLLFADGAERLFDQVILTLPPRALEKVVFDPPLEPEKRCAVEACQMSRVIKLAFQFNSKWWLDAGWGGSMQCDLPIQQTWDGSRGDAAILMAYVCGSATEEWIEHPDPIAWGVEQIASLYPQAREQFVHGWMHDWVSDPFSAGGFSNTAPGYALGHMKHIAPPHRRVHFAGEHTSLWVGFIEGALESAERAVGELLSLK